MTFGKKMRNRVFVAVLVLFILQVLLLPVFVAVTYATRSTLPEHFLTYGNGMLVWDKETDVDMNGVARLRLFCDEYGNIRSENGDRLVAPGSRRSVTLRLQNTESRAVSYTAVMYRIDGEGIPVTATVDALGAKDTKSFTVPKGIKNEDVIRAVSGRVENNQTESVEVAWQWAFENYGDTTADNTDTSLGNDAADGESDSITLGLFVTVTDGGSTVLPTNPQTGEGMQLVVYMLLLLASGMVLIILALEKRKDDRKAF